MSGHSKWSTIKHKKALLDAKRGKKFTKLIKEITVAARLGGGDPSGNPRLRLLLEKAKEINMPLDNATRAIKKGTGELPGQAYEAQTYEGYGPHNIAMMIDVLTDNKNKAIAELRHVFSRNGGRIADAGAVGWMFQRAGIISGTGKITEDQLLENLLDYDIINIIVTEDNTFEIVCEPKSLEPIKETLTKKLGLHVEEAELGWDAANKVTLDQLQAEQVLEFLQAVEELDDVQNVYTNME
ncbi:MAG: YebC/PmpR family DNA-binding transcriptional regulator [Candidatus Babeliaceae bacterium]|nr:YebC/PmpR family DNA-binding transcriptional regulator [Candidatus Babeliaceae bacterium]